jgi:hypothetical protein
MNYYARQNCSKRMRAKRVNRIRIYRDFSLVAERQREFALAWVETTSEKTLRLGRLRLPFSRFGKRNERATVLGVPSQQLESFGSLCRELQDMFGDAPIMLSQTSIAKLFKVSQQTISDWIRALRTLRVLRLAEPAIKNVKAARYYFTE